MVNLCIAFVFGVLVGAGIGIFTIALAAIAARDKREDKEV